MVRKKKSGPVNPVGGDGEGTSAKPQGGKNSQISMTAEEELACRVVRKHKKLYLFFVHYTSSYCHSFYEARIPHPNESAPAGRVRNKLLPILAFNWFDHGTDMCCVYLDSKFYFIGGTAPCHTLKEVRILDALNMPKPSLHPEESLQFLKPGPEMNTPKQNPVAFVANGEIFVLSGATWCLGVDRVIPFEKYTPDGNDGGVWKELATPPFTGQVSVHVVIHNKLYVPLGTNPTLYIYDFNSDSWDQTVEESPSPSFGFGFGYLFLEDDFNSIIYTCHPPGYLQSRAIDWSATVAGNSKVPKCLETKDIPVMGNSFSGVQRRSTYLVGGVRDGQFCYLQVGCTVDPRREDSYERFGPVKCIVKVTLIDSSTEKALGGAAVFIDPFSAPTGLVAAFAV